MTVHQQDTVIRHYEVGFEGYPEQVCVGVEAPADRSMIANFLPAVAKAREMIAGAIPDAQTRRITGFHKDGETIRYAVEGEYTNDGTPPTWIDAVYATDEEDARFQTRLAVALNEGWDFSDLASLRKHMKTIRVIQCHPEPFSREDITAAIANFLSAYNAGNNVSAHIQTLTKIAETCGHNVFVAATAPGPVVPRYGEETFRRLTETPIRAIDYRLTLEPATGLTRVGNCEGEAHEPSDDSRAYAQLLCSAPKMAKAIWLALPWMERTGIADSDPPEYVALKNALDQAIG